MTASNTAPAKPKFTRASGPKVRTGCITCKTRHLKCDGDHPFCRRCRHDKVKCDGYAMPKPKKPRKRWQPKAQAVQPVAQSMAFISTVNVFPSLTDPERHHFQHFLQWTSMQLSVSPSSTTSGSDMPSPWHTIRPRARYPVFRSKASMKLHMSYGSWTSDRQTKPWDADREIESADSNDEEGTPSLVLDDAFRRWNLRFEAMTQLQDAYLSTKAGPQLQNLCLRQQFWQLTINAFSSQGALSNPQTFTALMAVAKRVAAPFIDVNLPTFSLDGDLIFSLSFVASIAQDDGIKSQALDLLRKLNRREGIWDSHDVVEMHELTIAASKCDAGSEEQDGCGEMGAPAGIPGIIKQLRSRLGEPTKAGLVL